MIPRSYIPPKMNFLLLNFFSLWLPLVMCGSRSYSRGLVPLARNISTREDADDLYDNILRCPKVRSLDAKSVARYQGFLFCS